MGWNPVLHPVPVVSLAGYPRRQGQSFGSVVHTCIHKTNHAWACHCQDWWCDTRFKDGSQEEVRDVCKPVEQFLTQDTPMERHFSPQLLRDNSSGCMCQLNMIPFSVCLRLGWHAAHHTHTQWPPIEHRQHTSPTFSRLINSLGQVFGTLEACWYENVTNHFVQYPWHSWKVICDSVKQTTGFGKMSWWHSLELTCPQGMQMDARPAMFLWWWVAHSS